MTTVALPVKISAAAGADAAMEWLRGWSRGTRFTICHSGEVDGLASAALMMRFIERSGHKTAAVIAPAKGAHAAGIAISGRIDRASTEAIVVLDMPLSLSTRKPILMIDDDLAVASETAIDFSSRVARSVLTPPSSLTTYRVLSRLVDLSDVSWYASLGIVSECGSSASFAEQTEAKKKWGQKNLVETAALLAAGKRASAHDVDSALAALLHADSPADIANGMISEYDILDEYRSELQRERARCAKVSPQFYGDWAVLRFSSTCQIEGAIAASWVGRLPKHIVVSANEGYLPDFVCFTIRTRRANADLVAMLQSFADVHISPTVDVAAPDSVNGTIRRIDFQNFLSAIEIPTSK